MSSIRSFFLERYIRLMRTTMSFRGFDVDFCRSAMEKGAFTAFLNPAGVSFEPVSVNFNIPAAWIIPNEADEDKVLLYFHGGGYCVGSKDTHRPLVSKIAKISGIRALSIDYRLAPEHPYPAAIEDALISYEWLLEKGYKPSHILVGGDSAGGGLAMALLLVIKEKKLAQPGAAILLSPWTDLTMSGDSIHTNADVEAMLPIEEMDRWAEKYTGNNDPANPHISPLFGDFTGLCPVFIQVGSNEVVLDDSTRLSQKLDAAGVNVQIEIWDGMFHVWQFFWQYLPEGIDAIYSMADYIRNTIFRQDHRLIKDEKLSSLTSLKIS